MRNVFLLTGFNNWGKTTLINDLFGKSRFIKDQLHTYANRDFCVIPQSNDDLGEDGYLEAYHERILKLAKNGIQPSYIFSAFCPTREPTNDSLRIISSIYAGDQVFIMPIVYKWCGHAKLRMPDINAYYSGHKSIKSILPISGKQPGKAKLSELQSIINQLP